MNSEIAIFFIILLVIDSSFAAFLVIVGNIKEQKETRYIAWALFLKAFISLGPGIMLFNINLSWTTFFIGPRRVRHFFIRNTIIPPG